MPLPVTPSQTIGPFFHAGLAWPGGTQLFPDPATPGRRIRLRGQVFDADGAPVPDALLEFWQADGAGRFGGPVAGSCAGFGRAMTDAAGAWAIDTVLPGAVPGAGGSQQAPHVFVTVFARGLLRHVVTRAYFEGEAANATDPVLAACETRADTLIARHDRQATGTYRWDIRLAGGGETVFFDA